MQETNKSAPNDITFSASVIDWLGIPLRELKYRMTKRKDLYPLYNHRDWKECVNTRTTLAKVA